HHRGDPAGYRLLPGAAAVPAAVHAVAVLVDRAVRVRRGLLAAGGVAADAPARRGRRRGGAGQDRAAGAGRAAARRLDRTGRASAVLVPGDLLHDGRQAPAVRLGRLAARAQVPVWRCGAANSLDSGDLSWRSQIDSTTIDSTARNSLCQFCSDSY